MACIIEKAPERMTSRERVRRTFDFEKTDRVTIGYEANAAIHARLCAALGVRADDIDRVLVYPDNRIEIAYKIKDIFD